MSKKGVDALSNLPPWLKALVDPDSLERRRHNQIQEHKALQEKLRVQKMQIGDSASLDTRNFLVKQHISSHQGKLVEDKFPAGAELKWIQTMKTLDNLDTETSHDNTDFIMRALQTKAPDEIKTEQVVIDQTKDQKKLPRREVNDIFIDSVMANLEKSDSKSLIIHLNNAKNEIDPLALVLLKGKNGIWLHDPKYGASIQFKDEQTFKKFFKDHIQVNHEGFKTASITQVYNKEKLTAENTQKLGEDVRVRAETPGYKQQQDQHVQLSKTVSPTPTTAPTPEGPEAPSKTSPSTKTKKS